MATETNIQDSELEARYDKYKGIIKNFTLMSDIFMRNVFKQRECLEYVLQVIMEKQDLRVIDQIIQKDYKNMQGRSAVMDCVARDSEGKQFDVEIQQDNEGASPKRARYHSGLMDMNTLNPGQDFDELPESYVIFITRDDILGYGKGVELMCHEMEKIYSEGMESGEKRGELKAKKETALSMAEEGMDVKQIARLIKVSEKDVQKWIDENLCVMK